jgi:hypothetical protein
MTPEAARKKAAIVLNAAHVGTDPSPRPKLGTTTVAALAERLFAKLPLKPKTRREWERISTVEIVPTFAEQAAAAVTRGEVREWLDGIGRTCFSLHGKPRLGGVPGASTPWLKSFGMHRSEEPSSYSFRKALPGKSLKRPFSLS